MFNMFNIYEAKAISDERERVIVREAEMRRNLGKTRGKKFQKVHKGHTTNIYVMNKLGHMLSRLGDNLQNHYKYEELQHVS